MALFDPVAFLKEQYGFSVRDVRPPDGKADSSQVFIVTTEEAGEVVLKASFWYQGFAKNPIEALETVYQTIHALAERGLPIQRAYKNGAGRFVSDVEGIPWVTLTYFSGKPFSGTEEEFAATGKALGLFHKTGAAYLNEVPPMRKAITEKVPVEKPYEESRDLYLTKGFRELLEKPHIGCGNGSVCDVVRQAIPLIDETITFIDSSFKEVGSLTASILHNDFSHANGLYHEDGSFGGFLDADQLGVGPAVFDIGNTLASFATEFLKKGTVKELEIRVGLFLLQYHSVWPLREKEYALILAATQRWDIQRVLRTMRRHHFEDNRLPDLVPKVSSRFLPRIKGIKTWFAFLTPHWIEKTLSIKN